MTGYMDIQTYYTLMFNLMQHHNWSLSETYDLYPFERDIFVTMLNQYLEKLEEERNKSESGSTGNF